MSEEVAPTLSESPWYHWSCSASLLCCEGAAQASARSRRVKCELQMRLRALSSIGCTLNKGKNWSYSPFTVRVGGNVVRAGGETQVISSLAQHSGHRNVLLLMMAGVGQSAFLLSRLCSPTTPVALLSAWGCTLGFFLHCSTWLHPGGTGAEGCLCRTEDRQISLQGAFCPFAKNS